MSNKQSSTPHAALLKLFLRQPDTARDFLAFHLPAPIHALCDMKTLKLESSSFIDDDLRESYSDVLWSLALLLLAMSFVFISIIHFIERKGGLSANGR